MPIPDVRLPRLPRAPKKAWVPAVAVPVLLVLGVGFGTPAISLDSGEVVGNFQMIPGESRQRCWFGFGTTCVIHTEQEVSERCYGLILRRGPITGTTCVSEEQWFSVAVGEDWPKN